MIMSNLLKILNELPGGDYIRIRDGVHSYMGRSNIQLKVILLSGSLDWTSWESLIIGGFIVEGDTLYRIEDITSTQVKPLIYL